MEKTDLGEDDTDVLSRVGRGVGLILDLRHPCMRRRQRRGGRSRTPPEIREECIRVVVHLQDENVQPWSVRICAGPHLVEGEAMLECQTQFRTPHRTDEVTKLDVLAQATMTMQSVAQGKRDHTDDIQSALMNVSGESDL